MECLFILLFVIQDNSEKIIKCSIKNNVVYFYGASKWKRKHVSWFCNLVIWLWKSFGNSVKDVRTDPALINTHFGNANYN